MSLTTGDGEPGESRGAERAQPHPLPDVSPSIASNSIASSIFMAAWSPPANGATTRSTS